MWEALWGAIRVVWPHCLRSPDISKPNAIFDIESSDSSPENIKWTVNLDPLFPRFVQTLANEECELLDASS